MSLFLLKFSETFSQVALKPLMCNAIKAVHESFCESVKNDKELIFTLL
jgi:hypothetical protein